MKYNSHKAFSLVELIIVLVIIALLFAAMAPIITKRHIADSGSIESIWHFVNNDTERDAYFDPGAPDWTSSLYVGMDPVANNNHSGKLVINSKNITYKGVTYPQPQIQFRFSPNESELSNGIDAGSLLLDANGVHIGQLHPTIGADNTSLGFSTMKKLTAANGFLAVGTGALESANFEIPSETSTHITAIGTNAGYQLANNYGGNGIYIGDGAGGGFGANDIGIGYHAMFSGENSKAEKNIALGINSGLYRSDSDDYIANVLVNTNATADLAMKYNTIIGYNAYNLGGLGSTNGDTLAGLTAVGTNACNSIGADKGLNTCIGYGSGASINRTPQYGASDEHIFLGGVPKGFGGRGVMEVHTYGGNISGSSLNANSADVVLNSNLVIRGKLYIKDGNNVANYKFIDSKAYEPTHYRCISDSYQAILLSYNVYVCTDNFASADSIAWPRTINLLQRDGNAPNSLITSDRRLKTNIVENNTGLDKVLQLQPYNFTFKDDLSGTPQVGVIAQDLQKVFPESVSEDENGFLKIRWDEMFYAVINSIKELSHKIDIIRDKVVELRRGINGVRGHHTDILKQLSSLEERVQRLERK